MKEVQINSTDKVMILWNSKVMLVKATAIPDDIEET